MELGNMLFGHSRGNYPVNRDLQDDWYEILGEVWEENLPDTYDNFENSCVNFENDTFKIVPYWWGDCTCGADEYNFTRPEDAKREEYKQHCDDCMLIVPNFLYKPTGFEIRWYKYPMRDSYMNYDITDDEMRGIFRECAKSLENPNKSDGV